MEEERELLGSDAFMNGGRGMGALLFLGSGEAVPDLASPQDVIALLRRMIREIAEHEIEEDDVDDS